ncbi:suppressor of deletion of TFIIS [Coemansia sp. Benny D115]|nr:suppressor of deletion of TFIIS [Coemansia sp. Benny D115]
MTRSSLASQVFFFDIDNCLYPPSLGIDVLMKTRIYDFGRSVGLDPETVEETCSTYYRDYGLTVRGLVKHHGVDPVAFNNYVDASLPLESIISADPQLREILLRVKTRRWAFTNAGIDHAQRVLRCLGVDDLFEGITYCDYSDLDFPCKPKAPAYERAMREAGVDVPQHCYFVDDSAANVAVARQLGWTAVHVSPSAKDDSAAGHQCIDDIHKLPLVLPQLFD